MTGEKRFQFFDSSGENVGSLKIDTNNNQGEISQDGLDMLHTILDLTSETAKVVINGYPETIEFEGDSKVIRELVTRFILSGNFKNEEGAEEVGVVIDRDRLCEILDGLNRLRTRKRLEEAGYVHLGSSGVSITDSGMLLFGGNQYNFLKKVDEAPSEYRMLYEPLMIELIAGGWEFLDGIKEVQKRLPTISINDMLNDDCISKLEKAFSEKLKTLDGYNKGLRIANKLCNSRHNGYPVLKRLGDKKKNQLQIQMGFKALLSLPEDKFQKQIGRLGINNDYFFYLLNIIKSTGYKFPESE